MLQGASELCISLLLYTVFQKLHLNCFMLIKFKLWMYFAH